MERRSIPVWEGIKIVFIGSIYFLIAVISLQFSLQSSNATPIWPPSGFAFAVLLLFGRKIWPGVFLGAFAANLFVFLINNTAGLFTAISTSFFIAGGNSLEAIAGFYLVSRFLKPHSPVAVFKKVKSVFWFLHIGLVICLVSCTIGATAVAAADLIDTDNYFQVWFTWWVGDVTGILLFTPLIIAWYSERKGIININGLKFVETIIITLAITITCGLVFLNWFQPGFVFTRAFIIIPFLILAAVRLPLTIVVSLLLFAAVMTNLGTMEGIGPFVGPTLNDSLLTAETFIAVNCVMVLVLKAALTEDELMQQWLRSLKDSLEIAVKERTLELEKKNQELDKRNKELASFNYAASHDLQEPLRKIYTFTDRILEVEKDQLSERGRDYFMRMQQASERMKKLIDNLLAYLHVDSKESLYEMVDLNKILKQSIHAIYENGTGRKVTIDAEKLPVIRGISFQFEQLFANLLSNSVKFHKKGIDTQILIRSEVLEAEVLGEIIQDPKPFYYHISFQDNGIGFEEKYSSQIFEIFQRLHGYAEYAGTGIGLAICKKIIENHKGYISAMSKEGDGATFHIYLPVDEEEMVMDNAMSLQSKGMSKAL